MLNIYNIETSNYVNGNGCRYVLWLQGCNLGCIDCWNQQTWSFGKKMLKSVDDIFAQIKSIENKIDGITFSGGEPFLQALELFKLAKMIKENTKLNLQIFTGFEKSELIKKEQKNLLRYTDILVSGRYNNKKENNNQKVSLLNESIDIWQFNNSDIEINIDDNLDVKITGYPTNEIINKIKEI